MFEEICLAFETAYSYIRVKCEKIFLFNFEKTVTTISPEIALSFINCTRNHSHRHAKREWYRCVSMFRRATNFTIVDLMVNRAVHSVHARQQSPILQLLLSSEENHDSDIQLCALFRNTRLLPDSLCDFDEILSQVYSRFHILIITPLRYLHHIFAT